MPGEGVPPVRLQISATPAQVRTARLVAAAVARRSGVAEESLDEIRLAVGEACSRAVSLHRAYVPTELVTVLLNGDGRFVVSVCDQAPADVDDGPRRPLDQMNTWDEFDRDGPMSAGLGLGVIDGLVDDLQIAAGPDGTGTVVRMSWPLARSGQPEESTGQVASQPSSPVT